MRIAPIPLNEAIRLKDLQGYDIMGSEDEQSFDELVELAAQIYGCPIAAITFIGEERQWIKARKGIDTSETSRDVSFCSHTILEENYLLVEDAHGDDRFWDNPHVTGDPNIRFYVGAPIVSSGGNNIGSLCVIDRTPRQLKPEQVKALKIISAQVSQLLELRKKNLDIKAQAEVLINMEKKIAQAALLNQEKERAFIGRELHENLAQSLTAVKLYLDCVTESDSIKERFLEISKQRLQQVITDMRNLSKSIVPTTLSSVGFIDAINDLLESYRRSCGWITQFDYTHDIIRLQPETGLTIFRIIEEQLKNVKQHAQATQVNVKLHLNEELRLTIKDDGIGIDSTTFRKGFGFNNIVTRLEHLGGKISLLSDAKSGCTLSAHIPLSQQSIFPARQE